MIALLIVFSLLIMACYCMLIFKWNAAWNNIPLLEDLNSVTGIKLSVIIPVRNEASNMERVLSSLTKQTYPAHLWEIIVSDDQSDDNTVNIAKNYFVRHPFVTESVIETNKNERSSKKTALKKAIENATGELIITTDADCLHNTEWLKTIADFFIAKQPVMICGPVLMHSDSTFLQQFQTLDYLSLQASGAASLALNKPLLCSGANLAFTRRAFYEVNGYEDNLQQATGDDTFLMLKMHQRFPGKVLFLKSPNAVVTTQCSRSLNEFLQQRFRWISKTTHYPGVYIQLTGSFILFVNLLLLFHLGAGFYIPKLFLLAIVYLSIKTITDYFFMSHAAAFFQIRINKLSFLSIQVLYPVYLLALTFGFVRGSYLWKKRNHDT